ncbi:PRC-barrel domain-containing protein [Variovorax atrisoli]|uniref:PRC-barrel domain-containing protein n=1 Tax=Variovorax atrisoli TaxID=3394203 RepID=UPI00161F0B42|nr:PRC-barrel domain-containing protein [Variovorax sp. BK613]MBB3641873.1 sporulation protein YlmC with PRC-barrel domain [Variovorax sp. BK613]
MKIRHFATLGLVPALVAAGTGIAVAQVAGVTHAGATLTETGQLISGWSAKQSILGQAVYDASGERIGRALDLIVAPDRRVTFLIVEIGNFPSGSRHLVAVPASQLVVRGARLLLPDADRQALALQPAFVHAPITRTQSAIVEQALQDVDRAGRTLARLERQLALGEGGKARANLERQILVLRQASQAVEQKVAEMDAADADHWQAVEAQIGQAAARLRSAMRDVPA